MKRIRRTVRRGKQLKDPGQNTLNVRADGNCFYRAVSLALLESEDYYKEIKELALSYLGKWANQLKEYVWEGLCVETLLEYHRQDGTWADEYMFYVTAASLNCEIMITSDRYDRLLHYNEAGSRTVRLEHENEDHFVVRVDAQQQVMKIEEIQEIDPHLDLSVEEKKMSSSGKLMRIRAT